MAVVGRAPVQLTSWSTLTGYSPWLGATIVVQPASVGSQRTQPHLEDGSVYRQNRPTGRDSNFPCGSRCRGSQAPQPHLEDGTVYRQNRPRSPTTQHDARTTSTSGMNGDDSN